MLGFEAKLARADEHLSTLDGEVQAFLDTQPYDVRLEVFGTGDSIAVGLDERSSLRSVEPGAAPSGGHGYANFMERFESAYRDELVAFVSTVRDGGPSPCPLAEARAALVIVPDLQLVRRGHRVETEAE